MYNDTLNIFDGRPFPPGREDGMKRTARAGREVPGRIWAALLLAATLLLAGAPRAIAQSSDPPTTAELLGYEPDARVLIVNADDFGSFHAENVATRRLMEAGQIDSATLMAPCPWFEEAAQFLAERPGLDVGVHLTLNSEWGRYKWGPVAPRSRVPSLVTERGYFPADVGAVEQRAEPEDVRAEFEAQIAKVEARGIEPTHIDNHMGSAYGLETGRDFLKVVFALSARHNLPFRLPRTLPEPYRTSLPAERVATYRATVDSLLARGFVLPDHLVTVEHGDSLPATRARYEEILRNLEPGVTELYIHAAVDAPELRVISGAWRDRVHDYRIFAGERIHAYADSLGIRRIGWAELQELQAERLEARP